MKTLTYLFSQYVAPFCRVNILISIFFFITAVFSLFGEPANWRESLAWFCASMSCLTAFLYQQRCENLEFTKKLHYLNGSRFGSVSSVDSCKISRAASGSRLITPPTDH